MATSASSLLSLDRVNAYYGESHVLHDVSLQLCEGRLLALLGRNGAGKTTCISSIIGFLPPRSGRITLAGQSIERLAPERICRAGIGLVPQGRRIFGSLTVKENLDVAARSATNGSAKQWKRDDVCELFPGLKERQNQLAGSLSGGEQQMLAIGRALIGNPTVLLMDEPSEGLAPVIVEELARAVKRLTQSSGLAIVLVEQNTRLALDISPRAVVMDRGRIVYDGASEVLRKDPAKLEQLIGVVKA